MQNSPHAVIRVVPRQEVWEDVTGGRAPRVVASLGTRDRAIQHALELAHELAPGSARIIVERSDRTIEDEFTVAEISLDAAQ
jgi:hypothetical protein